MTHDQLAANVLSRLASGAALVPHPNQHRLDAIFTPGQLQDAIVDAVAAAVAAERQARERRNLADAIAAHHGWHPLTVGEQMRVGFDDGKQYTITRTE